MSSIPIFKTALSRGIWLVLAGIIAIWAALAFSGKEGAPAVGEGATISRSFEGDRPYGTNVDLRGNLHLDGPPSAYRTQVYTRIRLDEWSDATDGGMKELRMEERLIVNDREVHNMSFFHQAGHAEMTIGRQVEVFLYFPGDFEFEIPPSALRTGENEIEVRVAAEWVVHRPGGARVLMEAHPLEGGAEPILTDLSYVNSRFGIAPGLLVVLVATALLAASIPAANWLGSRFAARQSMKER